MSSAFQFLGQQALALGLARKPEGQWQVISDLLARTFGHKLFTSLLYLEDLRLMKRLHTSDETISPLGGFKATGSGPWSRHVLEQGQLYVASNEDDVRSVFSEAGSLIERGLRSALNIPVRHQGRVIGSLNLLAGREAYDQADRGLAEVIGGLCAPVFLQARQDMLAEAEGIDRSTLDSV